MAIRWHDVTIPMYAGMTVWPGDPPFEFSALKRMAQGDSSNTSRVAFCTHTGTHVDAPWHFEETAERVDEMDASLFFGEALLVEVADANVVTDADLGEGPLPPRLLIRTRNSRFPVDAPFQEAYVALDGDAAQRLVDEGVRLVGVDYLSVAPFKQEGQVTHRTLLSNRVLVVEGLRLNDFPAGVYQFTVLPLPIIGADGAPCRAFIGQEEKAS